MSGTPRELAALQEQINQKLVDLQAIKDEITFIIALQLIDSRFYAELSDRVMDRAAEACTINNDVRQIMLDYNELAGEAIKDVPPYLNPDQAIQDIQAGKIPGEGA